MDLLHHSESKPSINIQHDPDYVTLSRMLPRYQNLILLAPLPDEKIAARLLPWQQKVQAELRSPLPFHRMQWLRNIEGARTLLLKLEQNTQGIKVQRTRREVVKDLAEKRLIIKRLRHRIEGFGREVDAGQHSSYTSNYDDSGDTETMYDVLMHIRKKNGTPSGSNQPDTQQNSPEKEVSEPSKQLFEASPAIRRRQGLNVDQESSSDAKSSGYETARGKENTLLAASREHEDLTASSLNMATQLKQAARQFQFALEQEGKGIIDQAMENLEGNFTAMNVASKGMKSLQRMSEEQGWLGRLKLHAMIFGLWAAAILLVFAGPKLRF